MAESQVENMSKREKARGHDWVAGNATVQPGTFTEPGQAPRQFRTGAATDTLEQQLSDMAFTLSSAATKGWRSISKMLPRSPLATGLIGFGLGVLVGCSRRISGRRRWSLR
jgi:hypothetical protein